MSSTRLTFSPAVRALVTIGPAALGILLAVTLPILARWLVDVGFPVMGALWRVIAHVENWWKVAIQAALFAVAGAVLSIEILRRTTRVTLSPDEVLLETGDQVRTVPRSEIDAVFMEGDRLIILDRESRQTFRGEPRADAGQVRKTFSAYGYPWRDDDPFAEFYQPWVPGSGDLPVAVDAVLSARALALRKRAGKETAELRDSLEKLGYGVRDDGDRQQWRPLVRS